MNEDEMDEDMKLAHYLEIGAIELEGMDEDGEIVFSITEKAKELAPELWEAHIEHIDESLIALYEMDLIEVEYDDNLEAIIKIKPEGYEMAKEMGLLEYESKETPDN
jgi:hypothetical protein